MMGLGHPLVRQIVSLDASPLQILLENWLMSQTTETTVNIRISLVNQKILVTVLMLVVVVMSQTVVTLAKMQM